MPTRLAEGQDCLGNAKGGSHDTASDVSRFHRTGLFTRSAGSVAMVSPVVRRRVPSSHPGESLSTADLLLRETYHRCSNDLQLVVSLLSLQSRRATNAETRDALADVMARVAILARARSDLNQRRLPSLQCALRQVCEALLSQAEPRSILISMQTEHDVQGLAPDHIATLALVVNELATNAIKHAFEEGKAGHISISVRRSGKHHAAIMVDDDGLPFPEAQCVEGGGMGLSLVKRLVASANAVFIQHGAGSKCFEIRVPVPDPLMR